MNYLDGIRISGYRSFDNEIELSNLSKINILIGQNNSGKSNVLRFLSRHLRQVGKSPSGNSSTPLYPIKDKPQKKPKDSVKFAVQITKSGYLFERILSAANDRSKKNLSDKLFSGINNFWYYYLESSTSSFQINESFLLGAAQSLGLDQNAWGSIFSFYTGQSGGSLKAWQLEILKAFSPHAFLPKVDIIPATRSLRNIEGLVKEGEGYINGGIIEHGGMGLIKELFMMQNPVLDRRQDRKRFDQINNLIREVTGNDSVQLEIPHDYKEILVHMDGKTLGLESLGSGIEQVLIIAAKSTLFSNQIVCIEEPEIHLHPTLQRKLIQYLYEKTDNQYFIATHSPHFFDAVPASVYHIKLKDGYSEVVSAVTDQEKFHACADLGYKAGDLLQANCIIWVEGPSDRIYIRHWLRSLAPELKEGLHYSIMFYGGRLLSHLSAATDEAVKDFIELQKLNRNAAIVIDSDRRKKGQRINDTKKRVEAEFKKNGQPVWITEGRELENYLPTTLREESIKVCHKDVKKLPVSGKYEDVTVYWKIERREAGSAKNIDKIALAHHIEKETADLSVMGLRTRITELVSFVRSANLLKA